MVAGIDDDEGGFCFSEEDLFGAGYGDHLAIDSDFKRREWPFVGSENSRRILAWQVSARAAL